MAMALQFTTFFYQYMYEASHKVPKKDARSVRMGVLSTAMINPAAIIHPVETHAEVILYGVASRTEKDAHSYAQKYGFKKVYGSYQELLNDSEIDAVYIPLPNGMHYEWAKKSLESGKHVLLEKPFTSNASEARQLQDLASSKGKVLVEAFHWQFHPAAHVVEALIASGKYGKIKSTFARMTTPANTIPAKDIRWKYGLAGGALMDMTYVVSSTRFFLDAEKPLEVSKAIARPWSEDPRVDEAMEASLIFASDRGVDGRVESKIYADMNRANIYKVLPRAWEAPSIQIELEKATIYFYNFMMPHLYHYITVTEKTTGATSTQKHYCMGPKWGTRGEPWWSTYRYQLEAFIDKVKGREPGHWISLEDSINQMETIDMIYEKSGLGARQGTGEVLNNGHNDKRNGANGA